MGTSYYIAPEILNGWASYDEKVRGGRRGEGVCVRSCVCVCVCVVCVCVVPMQLFLFPSLPAFSLFAGEAACFPRAPLT